MLSNECINAPETVAELSALFEKYEKALKDNDVPALQDFFWPSEHALRFGVTEELYGATAIEEFRKNRVVNFSDRKSLRQEIVTIGADLGMATLEFSVTVAGKKKHGRQSQVWVRFEDIGWRIVSAHVSHKVIPANKSDAIKTYMEETSALLNIPVAPEYSEEVASNLGVIAKVASSLMAVDLSDTTEPAPEFEP